MAYEHDKYMVSKIEAYTQKFEEDRANVVVTMNADDPQPVMVDGLPLTEKCAEFVTELRKAMPDLKIGIHKGGDINSDRHIMSVAVYRKNDTYALGRIGFRDVGVSAYKHHYFVYSRKIINQKIYPNRWQYHIKSSEKLPSVIKAAKQYLIPYAPLDLAGISVDEFTRTVRRDRSAAHSSMRTTFREMVLGDEALFIAEIKRLVRDGYKFLNPKFADKVATYLSAEGSYAQEVEKRMDAYFMNIGDETTEVVEYENMVREDTMYCDTPMHKDTKVIKTEDIPFDLQLKISSLQVATPMHYVEGLGMRVGDRTFWVQR